MGLHEQLIALATCSIDRGQQDVMSSTPILEGNILVLVTGWGQEADRRRAREAGFDRHVVRPVDPDQIAAIIASY